MSKPKKVYLANEFLEEVVEVVDVDGEPQYSVLETEDLKKAIAIAYWDGWVTGARRYGAKGRPSMGGDEFDQNLTHLIRLTENWNEPNVQSTEEEE